ncbi:MAG: efflux RND transporter periplasmic adaptor subunit [Acidobacteria bacterium]|nr:efflux RND transporter periplasmic adaptor subunit [Acidobacteriota bacterium]
MKRLLFPLIGIVVLAVTVTQVMASRQAKNVAPARPVVAAPVNIMAEGRVVTYPGAQVTVGSDVAGTIESIAVLEKDVVRKGQVLAVVRADDTRAALAESRSRVGEADADIRLYILESERAQRLFHEDVGSKQAWEKAERDIDAARARRASAAAEVKRLEAMVAKTVIKAPIDGVVITRDIHPGEAIESGAPVVTIADLKKTRIEAEVDEFDAARVALGAKVDISAEGFDNQSWRGTIEEIPDAVTSRRLKPQDAAKPIDTRVLLVKVALGGPTPLKLGQRVEVQIATK